MAAVDDVDKLIEQYRLVAAEFSKGKPEPFKAMLSHREDVTTHELAYVVQLERLKARVGGGEDIPHSLCEPR